MGRAHVGWRDGEHHGAHRRAGHPPREALGLDAPPRAGALEGARIYACDQAHFSISRALDMLGFPRETLRIVPSDERVPAPRGAGRRRRRRGSRRRTLPFASRPSRARRTPAASTSPASSPTSPNASACGSTSTPRTAAAPRSHRGWRPRSRSRARRRVTIDPHKWFFQAYDIGALVVKRREDLRQTFHRSPEYYRHPEPRGCADSIGVEYSIEGTRRFRALKLWLSWKHLGTSGFARLVEHNVDLAAYLVARCREASDFEVVPDEPELSVVCFRHLPGRLEGGIGARRVPGPAPARARGERARHGSPRRRSEAPRTCARASSTTSRARRLSTGCWRRSGACPRERRRAPNVDATGYRRAVAPPVLGGEAGGLTREAPGVRAGARG